MLQCLSKDDHSCTSLHLRPAGQQFELDLKEGNRVQAQDPSRCFVWSKNVITCHWDENESCNVRVQWFDQKDTRFQGETSVDCTDQPPFQFNCPSNMVFTQSSSRQWHCNPPGVGPWADNPVKPEVPIAPSTTNPKATTRPHYQFHSSTKQDVSPILTVMAGDGHSVATLGGSYYDGQSFDAPCNFSGEKLQPGHKYGRTLFCRMNNRFDNPQRLCDGTDQRSQFCWQIQPLHEKDEDREVQYVCEAGEWQYTKTYRPDHYDVFECVAS